MRLRSTSSDRSIPLHNGRARSADDASVAVVAEDGAHGLVERAPRLYDVVVVFGQVGVQRDAHHEVGVAHGGNRPREAVLGEASAVGKDVHRGARERVAHQPKEPDEALPEQRGLAPGDADLARIRGDERDGAFKFVHEPRVVPFLGRL